ncbi:hypothetical protein ACOME3_000389 [Neoechinorhynchus agilis]
MVLALPDWLIDKAVSFVIKRIKTLNGETQQKLLDAIRKEANDYVNNTTEKEYSYNDLIYRLQQRANFAENDDFSVAVENQHNPRWNQFPIIKPSLNNQYHFQQNQKDFHQFPQQFAIQPQDPYFYEQFSQTSLFPEQTRITPGNCSEFQNQQMMVPTMNPYKPPCNSYFTGRNDPLQSSISTTDLSNRFYPQTIYMSQPAFTPNRTDSAKMFTASRPIAVTNGDPYSLDNASYKRNSSDRHNWHRSDEYYEKHRSSPKKVTFDDTVIKVPDPKKVPLKGCLKKPKDEYFYTLNHPNLPIGARLPTEQR